MESKVVMLQSNLKEANAARKHTNNEKKKVMYCLEMAKAKHEHTKSLL